MKLSEADFGDRTISLLSIPVLYFVYFIALAATGFYAGVCVSATFRTVSMWVGASLVLAAIPPWLHFKATKTDRRERIDVVFAACVLLLCTATGFLASSINRPNIDDSVYATKAVFYRENPDQQLDKTINWIVGMPKTAELPAFQYYEGIQASLAYLFNLPYLNLYHVIFPAIVGFLISLGALLALSVFEQRKRKLALGLLILTLLTVSLGETELTFGNYSVARAFHGKILFFAAGLPIWLYLSLRFFVLRRFDTWFVLLAAGVCMVATTSTALVLLPLFAAVIFASYVCSSGEGIFTRRNLELGLAYVSALTPVALLALEFRSIAQRSLGTHSLIATGYPLTFGGQLDFFINHRYPLTPILFCAALVVIWLYSAHRRFFAAWVVLMFVLFLNPLVIGFILKTIVPEIIYWRLFYLLPFPIIVAIAFFAIPTVGAKYRIAIRLVLVALSVAAVWGPTSVIRRQNGATLGWPGYKIEEPSLSAVKEIARIVPKGSMFAPVEISSNMLIYSSKYPQFYMRDDFFGYTAQDSGAFQMFVDRTRVYNYLFDARISPAGTSPDATSPDARELARMLASPGRPQVVVLPDRAAARAEIQDLLTSNNYVMRRLSTAPYVLYLSEGSEKSKS